MGFPHTLDKRLAKATERIARKKTYLERPLKLIEGGKVTELHRAPVPEHEPQPTPYLAAEPHELVQSEHRLVDAANATLEAGFQFCHDVLTDPTAPVGAKFKAMELALKGKANLTRTLARSARHDSWACDEAHMPPEQRAGFRRQLAAHQLAEAGYEVRTPKGKRIMPRDRTPVSIDDD